MLDWQKVVTDIELVGKKIAGGCEVSQSRGVVDTYEEVERRWRMLVTEVSSRRSSGEVDREGGNMNLISSWTEQSLALITRQVNVSELSQLREIIRALETAQGVVVKQRVALDELSIQVWENSPVFQQTSAKVERMNQILPKRLHYLAEKEYEMNQVFNEFLLLEREVIGAGMDVNSQLAKEVRSLKDSWFSLLGDVRRVSSIMAVSSSPDRSISSYQVTPSTLGSYTAKAGNNVEVTSPSDSISSMASLVTLTSPTTSHEMVASHTNSLQSGKELMPTDDNDNNVKVKDGSGNNSFLAEEAGHTTNHLSSPDVVHGAILIAENVAIDDVDDDVKAPSICGGGGNRGGQRNDAGRKSTGRKDYEWSSYKPLGKKKEAKLKASHHSIKDFFKKQNKINESVAEPSEELNKTEDCCAEVFESQQLPFFLNGCFATAEQKISESNYTCAIDSVLAVCEAILLTHECKNPEEIEDSVLREAMKILDWRLRNKYQWNHPLRNSFWNILSIKFPQAIQPLGRVDALAEFPMFHLNRIWPLVVKFELFCSERNCSASLGEFTYKFEDPILVSHPFNSELALSDYDLSELCLNRINKQVSKNARYKVRCSQASCPGVAKPEVILPSNLKIGKYFFLNFGIVGNGPDLSLNCRDSCVLDNVLKIGENNLELCSVLFASQQHFFTIAKMHRLYYKLDNMVRTKTATGYPSLSEAYSGKVSKNPSSYHLSSKSVRPRKGAPFFAVFINKSWSEPEESGPCQDLNDLPVLTIVDLPRKSPEGSEGKGIIADDVKTDQIPPATHEYSDIPAKMDSGEDSSPLSDENSNTNDCRAEESFQKRSGADFINDSDAESLESCMDIEQSNDEESEEEKLNDSENNYYGEDLDGPNDGSEDEALEVPSQPVGIDYRLQDFQDLGRYQRNNPGAFYNHYENAWYCSICIHFSKCGNGKRHWVDIGVKLGRVPGQRFRLHFESTFHKQNSEVKKMFEKARQGKDKNFFNVLKSAGDTSEEQIVAENREVVKIMFKTVLYQIKHLMANRSYTSLLEHIADCGAETLKKFASNSKKNATYFSVRTFDKMLDVLNTFIEKPLIDSLKQAQNFCVYHDETTDIRNHSEAAVYVMFIHEGEYKEHYLGIINMAPFMGLTAENFYTATLKLFEEKGVDLKNAACSDLDGCATNQGVHAGFKLYFNYHNPFHLHQSCNCHALALIPKRKVAESRFRVVSNADKIMISLFKHFKESSVRTAIFENCQIVLEDQTLKLICPSSTRWLSHEACFRRILEIYPATVMSLAQLYEDRGEVDALGILMQIIDPQFILAAMMLADMLGNVQYTKNKSPVYTQNYILPHSVQLTNF